MKETSIAQRRKALKRLATQLKKWVETPQELSYTTGIHISTCYDYFQEKYFPNLENQIKIKRHFGQISFDYCVSTGCF